jgi:hypothetical protein
MSLLRNLSRNLWNAIDVKAAGQRVAPGAENLHAVRQQRVPGVLGLGRFRDGFEQLPGHVGRGRAQAAAPFRAATSSTGVARDGFDSGRRSPLDLSGGLASRVSPQTSRAAAHPPAFGASLDQLAALF